MHRPRRRADHEGRVARSIGRSPAVIAPKDRAGATSARATPGERAKADTDVATARSFRAVDRDRGRVPRGQPLLSCLRVSKLQIALLINFNVVVLPERIQRVALWEFRDFVFSWL